MKYKYMIFGSMLTIILISLLGIIMIPFNKKAVIYVKEVSEYSSKITKLKNNIKDIEDGTCKETLNTMLTRINETNFDTKVTIEEYYNAYYKDGVSFIKLYENVVEQCELKDTDDIYLKVLEQSIFPDSIKEKYLLSHELILKDYSSRDSLSKNNSEKGTFVTKTLEMHILYDLIEEVQNEEA